MTIRDIFIVSTARTAIGTFGGSLKDVPNTQLATTAGQGRHCPRRHRRRCRGPRRHGQRHPHRYQRCLPGPRGRD